VSRIITIADMREAARSRLPRSVFDFVDGGALDEVTLARNRRDFDELELHPNYLVDVATVSTATSVLGTRIAVPIISAPTGLQGLVHHDGEVAMANAVHRLGSIYTIASRPTYALEEVAARAAGPKWMQMYVSPDRDRVKSTLRRGREAGYSALVVTIDGPRGGLRERDMRSGFTIPPRVSLRSIASGVRHPAWTAGFLKYQRYVPAIDPPGPDGNAVELLSERWARQLDASLTWDDLSWLRDEWGGPFLVKGILRVDDAVRAARIGASGVIVSNHGGRQLDGAPSTISVLSSIAAAVGDELDVILDSGVRRGTDVVKALALGARACLVGRAPLYGLAVGGEDGAYRSLEILADEVENCMALIGAPTVEAIKTVAPVMSK